MQLRNAYSAQLNRIHTVERAHLLIYAEIVERAYLIIYAGIVKRAYLIIYAGIVERGYLIIQWAGISGYDFTSDMGGGGGGGVTYLCRL